MGDEIYYGRMGFGGVHEKKGKKKGKKSEFVRGNNFLEEWED